MTSQKLPLTCEYRVKGQACGGEPVKFFKNLRRGIYMGFCEKHVNEYPDGWAAFKPVSKEEVLTHEVMDS
jgi:hypothetical protein